jgi:hypothetical protein
VPTDDRPTQLTPWRAALARARHHYKAEALLDLPDADFAVPELPVQILHEAITEIGLADAGALLELATPEQVQGLLDLDVWQRDKVSDDRTLEWLSALGELGPEALGRAMRGLDPELVALFLRRHAEIIDLTLDGAPEDREGPILPTPDHFFWLAVEDQGEAGRSVERLVEHLYRYDADFARKSIQAARWDLDSSLEEFAYRWRSGRMADLGFPEYYEALEVYRFLDPASVKVDEQTADRPKTSGEALVALTGPYADALGGESFFGRAMAEITDPAELERLQQALATLCNHVLAADRVEPSDKDAARESLARVRGFLSLGLEFLGRGAPETAAAALRSVALQRLFRVGVSLALKLRRLVDLMAQSVPITLVAGRTTLLDDPFGEVAAALFARPPRVARVIDAPPAAGQRPFEGVADIKRITTLIEEAAAQAAAVTRVLDVDVAKLAKLKLGGPAPGSPDEVRFGDLVRTALVRRLGGGRLAATPLKAGDVEKFVARATEGGKVSATARAQALAALEQRLHAVGRPVPERLPAWLDRWLAPLDEHVAGLQPPMSPRLVASVLMAPTRAPRVARPAQTPRSAGKRRRRS